MTHTRKMADSRLTCRRTRHDAPCLGCERLLAILAESTRRLAAEPPEPVDLSPQANLQRLLNHLDL